jgi:hypothetical protein
MQMNYCSNCGAAIESNLRFCRRCGHAIDLSEATTRTLDVPSAVEQATQHINSAPTAPSYMPPGVMPPMHASTTSGLRRSGPNRTVILLASLVGFLLIALAALVIITAVLEPDATPEQPRIAPPPQTTVGPPPPPPVPPGVIVPHPPPPPATASGTSTISREMIYPGAAITMEINRAEGGSVLQLHTTDSFDKVVSWYTTKLRPTKTMRTVGPTAILRGEGFSAIISGSEDGANIVLKQEEAGN